MQSELVKAVFQDELERTNRLILRNEAELNALPKGSIFKRRKGNQEYLYLNYREGKKVISKFLGNVKTFDIDELNKKLEIRKDINNLLKKLRNDKKSLEKELLK